MKKVASIVLSIILAMNLVLPVNAGQSDFGMMDANRTALLAKWMDAGVIKGYEDGSFQPDKEITRAEMVQVLANLFQFQSGSGTSEFTDVDSSKWYFSAVDHAYGQQIVQGYPDGTFGGDGKISKEDAVVMLYKAFRMTTEGEVESQFSDAQKVSDYAQSAVAYFEKMGYISGDSEGRFLPKAKLSRIELMEIIDAIVDLYVNEDDSIVENVAAESLLIVAKNVKIKNVQIGKSLFIADSVGDSDVQFEELSVQGTSYLSGGGSNSIHFMNSKLGFVVVDKRSGETLRVFLDGETSVDSLDVKNSVILEDATDGDGHGILKLKLSKDLGKESILKLIGNFAEVESEADEIDIQLEGFIAYLKNNGIGVKVNSGLIDVGENSSLGDIDLVDGKIATNQPNGNEGNSGNNGNDNGNTGNGSGNNNGNISNEKMWTLSWSDEFNGNTIDATKWTYDIGNWIVDGAGNGVTAGWGNNEKEYYTDSSDNSYVKAGKLVIEAKEKETTDQFGTYDYTSAKLKTKGIFSQTYGRYEVKAKLPVGK
ncbi:MAG: S-layer homology domain-containing protein, partial [Vallitaleaceae bacterium]|nr:S-layer homology domain-containing protein [Vallitaleaceae bacterium]